MDIRWIWERYDLYKCGLFCTESMASGATNRKRIIFGETDTYYVRYSRYVKSTVIAT